MITRIEVVRKDQETPKLTLIQIAETDEDRDNLEADEAIIYDGEPLEPARLLSILAITLDASPQEIAREYEEDLRALEGGQSE